MSEVARLRALAPEPAAQAECAAGLLRAGVAPDVLLAALKVLARHPTPKARPGLLAVYDHYAADGPRRDPGAYMRRGIVDALRPVASARDDALFASATETYEFLPPFHKEEAQILRSGGLLGLSDQNERLARYHAARLLVDDHTAPMSGEPAVTAARVLAALGETVALYQYVLQPAGPVAEVTSECLRGLVGVPKDLVPAIVARYRDSESPAVRIGLYDLLIGHSEGPLHVDYLADALVTTEDLDALRYLAIALLSARRAELAAMVVAASRSEPIHDRKTVLAEALDLFHLPADGTPRSRRGAGRGGR